MDFALQASPDHPWVTEHPEWFSKRADGSIAYAENPPKKYQDIYPINFDNDRDGIYLESLRIIKLWMSHGVRIFRVDNPHTKPVNFWAWLLAEVRRTDPDVLFLAEAFTKPAMMHALGKAGFQQSYTYFTWRNEKWEIEEYMKELTTETRQLLPAELLASTRPTSCLTSCSGAASRHSPSGPCSPRRCPRCGASTPVSSCSRTRRSPKAARSTWTRRSSSTARATGRPPRSQRREPQHAARKAEPDPQRAPRTAAAARSAFPPRSTRQCVGLLQEAAATMW